MKELLGESQRSPAKYIREQYFLVYELPNNLLVYYDSASQHYDICVGGESTLPIGDTRALIDWLADKMGIDADG